DPPHSLSQQYFCDALLDLQETGHTEHELNETVIEEGNVILKPESLSMSILCPKAAWSRFSREILIAASLQIARKRCLHDRLEPVEVEKVPVQRSVVAAHPFDI